MWLYARRHAGTLLHRSVEREGEIEQMGLEDGAMMGYDERGRSPLMGPLLAAPGALEHDGFALGSIFFNLDNPRGDAIWEFLLELLPEFFDPGRERIDELLILRTHGRSAVGTGRRIAFVLCRTLFLFALLTTRGLLLFDTFGRH